MGERERDTGWEGWWRERETAQNRKERGRVEEHDKEVRMCTSEPVKGNEGQEQRKRDKNRKGEK